VRISKALWSLSFPKLFTAWALTTQASSWESLSKEEALKNAEHKLKGYFKAPRILKE